MILQETKAIWVSFVVVLKVHNVLKIKATFLEPCSTLLSREHQDPMWGKCFRNLLPSPFGESWFIDLRIFQSH